MLRRGRDSGARVHLRGRRRSRTNRSGDNPRGRQDRRASGCAVSAFRPGSTVRIDAVVRTRKIGHFFPAGTVDAFDVWLEFKATDAGVACWHGAAVEDNGRGPVEKGAHFYRSLQLDGEGNPINKRNAWQTRSVFYVRLIPPGAADTVHFRSPIPKDVEGPITLETKLNYRKFQRVLHAFSSGVAQSGLAGSRFRQPHLHLRFANRFRICRS